MVDYLAPDQPSTELAPANKNPYEGQILTQYNPTWRDRLATGILNLSGQPVPTEGLKQAVQNTVGSLGAGTSNPALIDLTPAGNVLSAQEEARQGNYKEAAMAMMPGAPAITAEQKAAEKALNEITTRLKGYHGSDYLFEKFDPTKAKTASYHYFAETPENATNYGKHLYEVELRPKKLITFDPEDIGPKQMDVIKKVATRLEQDPEELLNTITGATGDFYGTKGSLQDQVMHELKDMGYDAVKFPDVRPGGGWEMSTVALDPTIIEIVKKPEISKNLTPVAAAAYAATQNGDAQAKTPETVFEKNKQYLKEGEHNYNTELSPKDELLFRDWLKRNNVPFDVNAKITDYDMRGFWKAYSEGDPKAKPSVNPNDKQIHYSDYWKTPYHESFSAESQWADPKKAPQWNDKDQLVLPDGTVIFDERAVNGN